MNRREFIGRAALCAATGLWIGAASAVSARAATDRMPGEDNAVSHDLPVAKKLLVYNEDDSHYFMCLTNPDYAVTQDEAGLRGYVRRIAKGGNFTHYFMCPNAKNANWDSKVMSSEWAFEKRPGKWISGAWQLNLKKFSEAGVDPYAIWSDEARTCGLSPWLSIRMNDIHNTDQKNHALHSDFWLAHPEFRRMPKASGRNWQDLALDYSHKEVRDYMIRFLDEAFSRYDVDGVELDWMRGVYHLTPGKEREQSACLDEVVAAARKFADKAAARLGHPVRVGVRIPTRPDDSLNLGMDFVTWAKKGWIDWIIPCNYFFQADFDLPYADWLHRVAAVNPKVIVVPGLDAQLRENGLRQLTRAEYAVFADRVYRQGAPGIYIFNPFCHKPETGVWRSLVDEGLPPALVAERAKGVKVPKGYDLDPKGMHGRETKEDVVWIDGSLLPLEGRGFADVESRYDRLPKSAKGVVPKDVWDLAHDSAGLAFRFRTDSRKLRFRWTLGDAMLGGYNLCAVGKSGIDVYERTDGGWHHVAAGCVHALSNELVCDWTPGREALVYLPNYNFPAAISLGIDAGTSVTDPAPRKSGVTKPVVIYGSSITQGASASHAGMAFVNLAGRIADVEMVNLGFSGAGRMEREVLEFIKQTDASCYVIDSAWNINSTKVAERWEPFVRALHAAHPDVPIVFMEPCHESHQKDKQKSSEIIRACYEKLRREDPKSWARLYLLRADEQMPADDETTVEGTHPNDWGMMHIGRALGRTLIHVLVQPTKSTLVARP